MRILYITHTKDGSGARKALVNMARGIMAKGHSVFVMTPCEDCPVSNDMRNIGATVIVAPVCSTVYPKTNNIFKWVALMVIRLWKWQISRIAIKHAIIDNDIDIVHSNVGPLNLAPKVCRFLGIPHVWHIREFQMRMKMIFFPKPSSFMKYILSDGNYNIAITNSVFKHYSLREDYDRVIYDGVFPASIVKQNLIPINQRHKNILYVGRVEEIKGTLELIKAFVNFQKVHTEWKLIIVGSYRKDDIYYKDCKRICEETNTLSIILFEGKRSNVYEFMRNARIVVVPSIQEGFGFVPAEGMANGCLIIGRNVGGIREQLDNGKRLTGGEIALRFETQEELVEQLNNAAENDYTDMIERGRKAAVELYSLEKTSEQVERYYKWILNNYEKKKS